MSTVLTVGFGDVTPQTIQERAFATVSMFIGALFFGYIIASMSNLVSTLDVNKRAVGEKMDAVTSYMNKRKLPRSLQVRLCVYVCMCVCVYVCMCITAW